MSDSYSPTEKQRELRALVSSSATHVMAFGGSRSGKTFEFARVVTARALSAARSRHAMLRYRFNHIKASIVLDTFPKMMEMCFKDVDYSIDKTDWYARLDNDSQIWFGGIDDKERTEKILGQEYVTILLNECSQIPESSRNLVMTRLAQKVMSTVKGLPPTVMRHKALYDCNPP